MKVGIIGLGLMGASFAKILHAKGVATVLGTDIAPQVLDKAKNTGIIDAELTTDNAKELDMLIVTTFPRHFRDALQQYLPYLKDGTVVTDFCGTKRNVLADMQQMAAQYPALQFVGGHPMAGSEYCGIDHAQISMFYNASVILVPCACSNRTLDNLKQFYLSLGFGEVVVCDADWHDAMIAYTSQLCHVVSNAFIKNDSAKNHGGYSAGSYKDLTRVARMNSCMWSQLMIDNRDKLSAELSQLIHNLTQYQQALEEGDEARLHQLLEEGNQRKLQIDKRKSK